jgi:hypothetical protein
MLRTPSWNDDGVSSCASHSGCASNDDITIDCVRAFLLMFVCAAHTAAP